MTYFRPARAASAGHARPSYVRAVPPGGAAAVSERLLILHTKRHLFWGPRNVKKTPAAGTAPPGGGDPSFVDPSSFQRITRGTKTHKTQGAQSRLDARPALQRARSKRLRQRQGPRSGPADDVVMGSDANDLDTAGLLEQPLSADAAIAAA